MQSTAVLPDGTNFGYVACLCYMIPSNSLIVVHSARLHAPVHRVNGFSLFRILPFRVVFSTPRSARRISVRSESFVMASGSILL